MSTDRHEVPVTGLGVVSSIGIGHRAYEEGLRQGRSGITPITRFDTSGFPGPLGGEIRGFDPNEHLSRLDPTMWPLAAQFAAASAAMAVSDAGLTATDLRGRRILVCFGTTDGAAAEVDELVRQRHHDERLDRRLGYQVSCDLITSAVATELGLIGARLMTLGTACAAGNYAIGYAMDEIRHGRCDLAIAGGADAMCRKTYASFYRLGTIAPDACRPFDKDRKGILTAEGAATLILESHESTMARDARTAGVVLGYGLNCDAHHPVAPQRRSIASAIGKALADAQVHPNEVDFVSAHGPGTRSNDATECEALRLSYGCTPLPPVISVKSMLGHTMGAASALAAVASLLAIDHGFIPPTINHVATDPACDVDCVPNESRNAAVRIVQNNAFAFGGNNAVTIFGARAHD